MKKLHHLNDLDDYYNAELAARHKSTAGSQAQADPARVATLAEQLQQDGYIIIENLLSKDTVDSVREAAVPLFEHAGRNNFEGLQTHRLYSVLEKTRVCDALVEHPLVLGILDRIFLPNYLLSQLQVINILSGEARQPVHYDGAWYRVPRPRPAINAATIFAIDDFTEDNGATYLIPGSHTWGDRTPTPEEEAARVPAVMPAGSMLLFLGTLWHGGGENSSDAARMAVTAQYCEPWCRQQENFSLSISREVASQCSEHIQRMLGYSIYGPFMGFVDGKHPKRLLG